VVLNYIWIGFFLVAFVFSLSAGLFTGDWSGFPGMRDAVEKFAKLGFEIALGLTAVMTLWLGIMKVGEKGGAVAILARFVGPLFRRLFPGVPDDHPAMGSILMNFSANMLGLDNAATPLGLKAMRDLQELNEEKDRASDAMIMFLVLNTSGLTVIPVSVMALRAASGAASPSDIFVPILLTTACSSLAGLILVSLIQKINLLRPVVFAYLGGLITLLGGFAYWVTRFPNAPTEAELAAGAVIPPHTIESVTDMVGAVIIVGVIVGFVALAAWKRIDVFKTFIDGAKEGFQTAVMIIPYLVAMLVAIGVFRASGAMGMIVNGIAKVVAACGFDTGFVEALPTALMKPLSGGGARGMAVEAMATHGADSFIGKLACTFQGSTETTFYTLAVYFGAIGITRTRYAAGAGLFADFTAMLAAIFFAYLFFGGA